MEKNKEVHKGKRSAIQIFLGKVELWEIGCHLRQLFLSVYVHSLFCCQASEGF